MLKQLAIGFLLLLLVSVGVVAAVAWRPAFAMGATPVGVSGAASAKRGEVLAYAGNCATCHTSPGRPTYAGGRPITTSFGSIQAPNITPDIETGIGGWSLAAFQRALREGVARDGSFLFPALPYDHFTKLTDDDTAALYAYLMSQAAVRSPAPANHLIFPLNIRALQVFWQGLYFRSGRYTPTPDKSAEWNRGAYLAQAVAHCGACHTPRNLLGAERHDAEYSGAVVDGWVAPSLTRSNPSPAVWTRDELYAYLRQGVSPRHGTTLGPMGEVVHSGLVRLPDADIAAISVYFADMDEAERRSSVAVKPRATATFATAGQHYATSGERLYATACASCHYVGHRTLDGLRPDLAINSAIHLDDPTNLLRVMIYGVGAHEGATGVVMPGFSQLRDADLVLIATYLRAAGTDKPAWRDLDTKVARVRAEGRQP